MIEKAMNEIIDDCLYAKHQNVSEAHRYSDGAEENCYKYPPSRVRMERAAAAYLVLQAFLLDVDNVGDVFDKLTVKNIYHTNFLKGETK